MRVLLVTPRFPWPARDGGQICMVQHIRHLALHHELRLVSLESRGAAGLERAKQDVPDFVGSSTLVPHRLDSPRVAWLRSRWSGWPATLARYRSRELVERLRRLVQEWRPDVAVFENLHLAYLCAEIPEIPWVAIQQNVETQFLESVARARRPPWSWLYEAEAKRMSAWEPALLGRASAIVALQEREAEWMRRRVPGVSVHVVPIAAEARPVVAAEGEARNGFLILGAFDWLPNREAAQWLLDTVWPLVRERAPHAALTIVGRGAVDGALGREYPGVRWLGEVPEAGPHLSSTRSLLVPLRSGAGLRVKILEALAMGTPVITTPQGLEGIPAVSGEHLLIAGDARSFADAMLDLERDAERASALAARGRAWVAREYSWEKMGVELESALAAAVAARGRR